MWQLPRLCPGRCWWRLKGCSYGSEDAVGTEGCQEPALSSSYLSINDVSLGPPASFALMRHGGTSQSLSGKPTSRAAFLINHPLTVLALFSPPQFLLFFAGSSQCREPQRLTAQCSRLNLQQESLEISGVFALLQRAPRDEDFAAQLVVQSRACGASLWRHFLCARCLCDVQVLGSSQSVAGTFAQSFGIP